MAELVFDSLVLLLAGTVRGFSGFGFALVAVSGLALLHPPAEVVPAILCLEIFASIHLLPGVWSQVHWPSILWLGVGMVVGTAPGVWLLAHASPSALRLWVSLAVLFAAATLTREQSRPRARGFWVQLLAGFCSGVLNASASVGGPPVILYYLNASGSAAAIRASLIAFFVVADSVSLAAMAGTGLLTPRVGLLALLWIVPALAGVSLGRLMFERHGARHYRRAVVVLLVALAILGAGRAAWEWLAPEQRAQTEGRNF
ncbi:MAG: sulfite exporter TauE/SafE family protein [Candidatus Binatia bacterium]|nr:sulfite exporter TauE/SafE family protein [Candidatus Binatia bacterium]